MKTDESVVPVAIGELVASEWNRTDLGNGDLKQLSASIAVDGVLVPLIVRMADKTDHYEIVAGHRRWQAAKLAGLKEVPCVVRSMNDAEAKKVQVLENLHRKDLNPMEEAKAFKMLTEGNAHSVHTLADYVGKDAKYVHRALALLELPEKVQTAMEKGILTAAHGHQLARVGPKQIDTLADYALRKGWKGDYPSVRELQEEIGRRVEKKLSQAPFEKNKPFAGKIACKGCPSNTANQDMLFDEAEEGFCTNNTCFAAKLGQFYKDLQAVGEQRWPRLKFIGTAKSAYGNEQTIKGFKIVEAADPKVKKIISVKPDPSVKGHTQIEGWGFGIIKPSEWGGVKTPKLVVLKKMAASEKPHSAYREKTPEENAQAQHFQQFMMTEQAKYIYSNANFDEHVWKGLVLMHVGDRWEMARSMPWLRAAGIDMAKDIKAQVMKIDSAHVWLLAWLLMTNGNESAMDVVLDHNEINLKKLSQGWSAEAMKDWKARKDDIVALYVKNQEDRS